MTMTAKELKDYLDETFTDVDFSYKGADGSICPLAMNKIALAWNGNDRLFKTLDDLMADASILGAPLNEIAEKLNIY